MKNSKDYSAYLAILFLLFSLNSCSDDDDAGEITDPEQATATIEVVDQIISQNTLVIDRIIVGQDSWLVVRNTGTKISPEIVSDPVFIPEGTHENVEVSLNENANLTGNETGDDLVLMIHMDDPDAGKEGEYDFNGQNNADAPVTDSTGDPVRRKVHVTAPSLYAEDNQTVTENNEVTFTSVTTADGGWVNLYGSNADGTIDEDDLIGQRYVEGGIHTNFTVAFNEGYEYRTGQIIHPRLYTDDPADRRFTYTPGGNEDLPETYGYNPETNREQPVGNSADTAIRGAFTLASSRGAI